jgi:hypothetical protein
MEDNRRSFVKRAGAAAAGSLLAWNARVKGANDRPVLALIGGRNQGRGDATRAIGRGPKSRPFAIWTTPFCKRWAPNSRKRRTRPSFRQGFPARARRQGYRRHNHRDTGPLAHAHCSIGLPGRQGSVSGEAGMPDHPRGPFDSRCGAQIQPDRTGRDAAAQQRSTARAPSNTWRPASWARSAW